MARSKVQGGKERERPLTALIDTNILIDYFGQRAPYYEAAKRLKVASYFGDLALWATANSFTDAFYILNKENDSTAVQNAFLASMEYLKVCSITSLDIRHTAEQQWPDFEDCLVAVCADKVKADFILTRDVAGFERARVPALTPPEFLTKLQEEQGLSYAELEL